MTNGIFNPSESQPSCTVVPWNEPPSVKLRVGDHWVDITELGDILIRAGQELNAALKPGRSDD